MVEKSGKTKSDEVLSPALIAAFSSRRDEVRDALGRLYIKNNLSGRNRFRAKWPELAGYIFGEILISYDNDGVDDREKRVELEDEAEQKRIFLLDVIEEMPHKTVDSGALQGEYVGKVIDTFGLQVTQFLFSDDVIERVRPGLIARSVSAAEMEQERLSDEERKVLSNHPDEGFDALDDVQSDMQIDTEGVKKNRDDYQSFVTHEKENHNTEAETEDEDQLLDDIKPIETDQEKPASS